jgi:thiol-disulfide isomerase/thioredoxin
MTKLIKDVEDLEKACESPKGVFILFYATWCPFSQRFLPVYEKLARGQGEAFVRFAVDDNEDICDRHEIEVYPTVLYFKNGKVSKRLDGGYHVGLSERELAGLMESCGVAKD